jgi:hypothetical protein
MITDVVAAAWPHAGSIHNTGTHHWADFDPGFVTIVRSQFPDLPPDAVALAMRLWGRMHGLVTLEVYGQLRNLTDNPAKVYQGEITDLLTCLGLHNPQR